MGYLKKKRHISSFFFNFNSIKFELFQKGMPILSQAWICLLTTQYLDTKLREGSNFINCLLWFQTLFNNGEKVRLSMFKNHKADSHSLMILIIKTMQIQHSMAYIWILKSEKKLFFNFVKLGWLQILTWVKDCSMILGPYSCCWFLDLIIYQNYLI